MIEFVRVEGTEFANPQALAAPARGAARRAARHRRRSTSASPASTAPASTSASTTTWCEERQARRAGRRRQREDDGPQLPALRPLLLDRLPGRVDVRAADGPPPRLGQQPRRAVVERDRARAASSAPRPSSTSRSTSTATRSSRRTARCRTTRGTSSSAASASPNTRMQTNTAGLDFGVPFGNSGEIRVGPGVHVLQGHADDRDPRLSDGRARPTPARACWRAGTTSTTRSSRPAACGPRSTSSTASACSASAPARTR